jgi:hypothetical protein
MKVFLIILGVLVALVGLPWLIQGNDFYLTKMFAPKMEQVRYDTFKQSKSHIEGNIDDLRQDYRIWIKGDAEQRSMIRTGVIQKMDKIDEKTLPSDLYEWVQKLRQEPTGLGQIKPNPVKPLQKVQ